MHVTNMHVEEKGNRPEIEQEYHLYAYQDLKWEMRNATGLYMLNVRGDRRIKLEVAINYFFHYGKASGSSRNTFKRHRKDVTRLCVKGYLAARRHMNGIITTISLMTDSGLPCFSRSNPIGNFMIKTCGDAYNKWTTAGYDHIQYLQQGIEK